MISLESIGDAWNVFFHTPESPITISIFRIAFGALLVVNSLLLLREARLWYGPNGVYPIEFYFRGYAKSHFGLFSYLPATDRSVYLVLWLNCAAAVALMVGFLTPFSAAIAFVTLVSLHHRNPMINHSGDSLLRLMSFLLIFSQAGAMFSVDAIISGASEQGEVKSSPWCVRVMQLQLSILYFRAFTAKLTGSLWRNGTATYYTTKLIEFRRFKLPSILDNMFWVRVSSWGVMAVQFSLGTLVWIDGLRYPIILAAVLFHLSIDYLMNVQLFTVTMIICLFLFVDPADLTAFIGWIGELV